MGSKVAPAVLHTLAFWSSSMKNAGRIRTPRFGTPVNFPPRPLSSDSRNHNPKVYLSLAEWRNKKELEKSEKTIASTGELPPEMLPEGVSKGDSEEEGNRLYRRRVKKERQKDGSTP